MHLDRIALLSESSVKMRFPNTYDIGQYMADLGVDVSFTGSRNEESLYGVGIANTDQVGCILRRMMK